MLKTVSSATNAIGALNFKGTWNAATNTPTIVSGVGVKGDYFVVGVAGTTTIDGISNWGVGDWIAYNGNIWQRVEGGADLNGVNLTVSGTTTLSNLTASTALALNASKEAVSVTNTGTGDNVLATTPSLVGDVTLSTGNLVIGTSGKGIDFSADPNAGGMTSELLNDYEEGAWTPLYIASTTNPTMVYIAALGRYTKIGRMVFCQFTIRTSSASTGGGVGDLLLSGLPFTVTVSQTINQAGSVSNSFRFGANNFPNTVEAIVNTTTAVFKIVNSNADTIAVDSSTLNLSNQANNITASIAYLAG